jgi:hypothetical protein
VCDILAQSLIGLIGYSYQQGIPSFPEAHLKGTPGLACLAWSDLRMGDRPKSCSRVCMSKDKVRRKD